jgi:hypothetical protein
MDWSIATTSSASLPTQCRCSTHRKEKVTIQCSVCCSSLHSLVHMSALGIDAIHCFARMSSMFCKQIQERFCVKHSFALRPCCSTHLSQTNHLCFTSSSSSCARSRCGSREPGGARSLQLCVSRIVIIHILTPRKRHPQHKLTCEYVLPANLAVATFQDVLVHTAGAAKRSWPPLASRRNLELHTPPHRLRNTELSPEHLHLHAILCVPPLYKTSLERVCGLELYRLC